MINNLNVNGVTYQNVAKLRVKRAGANTYADLVDTSDADALYTEIKQGKKAYVNGSMVVGSYAPPSIVSPSASGEVIVGDNQQEVENVISFFDEYGALLHTIDTTDNTQFPLSELPSLPPAVTNYTFSWNKTLAEVNEMTTGGVVKTNVVAASLAPTIYIPDDCGWTGTSTTTAVTIVLYFSSLGTGSAITLTIDWGDGTTASTVNISNSTTHGYVSSSHTFSAGVVHTNPITITPSSSVGYMIGGYLNTSYNYGAFGQTQGSGNYGCLIVKEIRMGDGATFFKKNSNQSISNPSGSFRGCVKLEKIIIPNSVASMGKRNFSDCFSLQNISLPDSCNFDEGYEFYNCYSLSNVLLGNTQTKIPEYAFTYCRALASIKLPNITAIDTNGFMNCCFSKITLPNTLTTIGSSAFNTCYALREATIPSSVTSISNNVYAGCYALNSCIFETGSTLTTIGGSLFSACFALEKVVLPSALTSIPSQCFYNCYALKEVIIPDTVTTIGDYAFYYCFALINITIPSGVTSIGAQSFYNCCGLRFLTSLPENVPTLGSNALPQIQMNGVSSSYNSTCLYYVPSVSLNSYKTATNWATYANNMRGI